MEAPKKRKAEVETGASAKKPKTSADAEAANSPNLFVGNLSWNVDEEWLRRAFESFGELSDVRIMTDRETGRSRG
jgi:nucleolin